MFTGIVRAVGTVADIESQRGDARLRIESTELPWARYEEGDSILVNGACLTAATLDATGFTCDVSRETLSVTTLGELRPGSRVNLEPALTLADRLGGHLVSGHVDAIGKVTERRDDARSIRVSVGFPGELRGYLARKGSICVDGVSLTINEVSAREFSVNIIPHTARETIIGQYRAGTRVNLEVDLVARYLESLAQRDAGGPGITREFLERKGYA
jgi:riboflavin synthase